MRHCLMFLLPVVVLLLVIGSCRAPLHKEFVQTGPFMLHVWIYYGEDPAALRRVVDSSHCRYSAASVHENDGFTRMDFCFRPDPSSKQLEILFKRLNCYKGMRSFATTRGR